MTRIGGLTISFDAEGETDSIFLPPGRWAVDVQSGGSTIEIQRKGRRGDFRPIEDTPSDSEDQLLEILGGFEYRADITTYVDDGTLDFIYTGK